MEKTKPTLAECAAAVEHVIRSASPDVPGDVLDVARAGIKSLRWCAKHEDLIRQVHEVSKQFPVAKINVRDRINLLTWLQGEPVRVDGIPYTFPNGVHHFRKALEEKMTEKETA